jgi:hypothetical protein
VLGWIRYGSHNGDDRWLVYIVFVCFLLVELQLDSAHCIFESCPR